MHAFREVQQQLTTVQHAQAQLWAERSQLAVEQEAVAGDKAQAVQKAQEAATAHASLLLHLRQLRAQSVLVPSLHFSDVPAATFVVLDVEHTHLLHTMSSMQCDLLDMCTPPSWFWSLGHIATLPGRVFRHVAICAVTQGFLTLCRREAVWGLRMERRRRTRPARSLLLSRTSKAQLTAGLPDRDPAVQACPLQATGKCSCCQLSAMLASMPNNTGNAGDITFHAQMV